MSNAPAHDAARARESNARLVRHVTWIPVTVRGASVGGAASSCAVPTIGPHVASRGRVTRGLYTKPARSIVPLGHAPTDTIVPGPAPEVPR